MTVNAPVLTLEDTLASQKDLSRLCSDRPLKTREIFEGNAFYGDGIILKLYASLPRSYPLKVVIPHGLVFSEEFIWTAEARAPVPVALCHQPYRVALYATKAGKVVFRSAAPIVYLARMLDGTCQRVRNGTIFFPHHSTHHITADMDHEALAAQLANLPAEYQPVTVCVYWRDFNLGRHLPFRRQGLNVVSAGHIYDPAFLFRFYHLCAMHKYSASNSIGSSLFYSVKLGCSFFLLETVKHTLHADVEILKRDGAAATMREEEELDLRLLFSKPQAAMSTEQLSIVDEYLGANWLLSPQVLRRRLLQAELLDKLGFFVHNRGHRTRLVVPSYYRRTAMQQAVKLMRFWRRVSASGRKSV